MADRSAIEESRRIREWLLGILRFAITLERSDRAVVMDIAAEMDRLGSGRSQTGFSYFTRTSVKLCDCIIAKNELDKLAVLRFHIDRVADDRLRRAFEGALFERRSGLGYFRNQNREYLWKGLPVR